MDQGKLTLYHFAKLTNEEILLQGMLQTKRQYPTKFLEKYRRKPNHFKIKVIATKILYSIIFGILPLLPVLTYFQIARNLIDGLISVENIILTGSVFFGLYFALQFFNFFLMCILESGMIMSGTLFAWFKTLPISREKLGKLAYLTLFRSFDIPIIVMILGFPITMLIGTQNVIIFFVCLGISILNIIFSFDIVILLGKRLNRVMDFNTTNSKRSLSIRLINIFSYLFIILSSVYLIQWAFGNIETIFLIVIGFEQSALVNLILSIVPYPFNPSYLVTIIIIQSQINLTFWISTLIGLGLFVLLTWWIHSKTSKTLEGISHQEPTNQKKNLVKDKIQVEIKTYSSLGAFLRKDLSIITHDLKTFMAIIMPIILSCIFTFSFNFGSMNEVIEIERHILIYCVGILIFCPIISGMFVYGLNNIEISGQSITVSLPISPREQAKAKIILLMIFQTIAVFTPLILYITNLKFNFFLLASIVSLPFTWIILILTFEMKILFFGKLKKHYKIDDVNPENRFLKWTLIISLQYIIAFWTISFVFIFRITLNLIIFYFGVAIVGVLTAIFIFDKTLPIIPEFKIISKLQPQFPKEGKQTTFTQHGWLSIIILSIFYSLTVYLSSLLLHNLQLVDNFPSIWFGYDWSSLVMLILFNLSYTPLLLLIIPKIFGLPYGKKSIKEYLGDIKVRWINSLLKYLLWASIGVIGVYLLSILIGALYGFFAFIPISIGIQVFQVLGNSCYIFWQELFYRGVILTFLLKRRKKLQAIMLNALIYLVFSIFALLILFSPYGLIIGETLLALLPFLVYSFIVGIISAYLCVKTNSIIPGILTQIIAYIIGIGLPSFLIFSIGF